jgi:hypothetical protein
MIARQVKGEAVAKDARPGGRGVRRLLAPLSASGSTHLVDAAFWRPPDAAHNDVKKSRCTCSEVDRRTL